MPAADWCRYGPTTRPLAKSACWAKQHATAPMPAVHSVPAESNDTTATTLPSDAPTIRAFSTTNNSSSHQQHT